MKISPKTIAPRVLADLSVALGALAISLSARYLIKLYDNPAVPREILQEDFVSYFQIHAPLFAVSLVAALASFGAYTRTRYYLHREKMIMLAKAVSLAFVVFIFASWAAAPAEANIPRGAFAICYLLTLAMVLGGRMAKDAFERRFTLTPNQARSGRPVRKVLVVGGAGYIGSGMVRDLLADGYRVRVLDSTIYGDEPIRELYGHPNFEMIRGDFRHVGPVVQAVKGMDAVVHLGAIVGDPACAVNENETIEINLAATKLLAEVCKAQNVSRLLFASTCSVYGAAEDVVDEKSWLNPVSLYAATKIDSENVLRAARSKDFHPVIMRLATAYGWSLRPRFDLVVNLLAAKAAVEKKIVIYNGQQWRPFIHVADISRAFRAALAAPIEAVSGETFNAGSGGMNFTLQELAEVIKKIEPGLAVEYVVNDDARNYRVSFDKIKSRLGFDTQVKLEDGIREIQQAIRDGKVSDYRDPVYSNVQLVTQLTRQLEMESAKGKEPVELTALRFTKNGAREQLLAAVQSGLMRW
jgi:nucleoside-diphosphate-sugar epimerase